jgi:hypothetical protein
MSFFLVRPTQEANSLVLGTVAERRIRLTWSGNMIITSSHTTPLYSTKSVSTNKRTSAKNKTERCSGDSDLQIIDVVNFIKDHEFDVPNDISPPVKHTPQNLRRHNQTRSLGPNLHVPRQDTDVVKGLFEIAEFLVTQCLDRGRINCTTISNSSVSFGGGFGYRVICFAARAMAYSATTVFPAEVCAATNTESPFSR